MGRSWGALAVPIARLRYTGSTGSWNIYWRDQM